MTENHRIEYKRELTGSAFSALAQIFRAMCIDPHDEMKAGWRAMRDDTGPGLALEDSAAGKVFFDVSHLTYARLMNEIVPLVGKKDPLATMREMAKISAAFRANYEKAAMIAEQGGQP